MISPKIIISSGLDTCSNLFFEDQLFREILKDEYILFLYSNSPCLVIGRFQDPWKECNFELMNKEKIPFVRRQSGGGAVYHDSRSLNFSFISSDDSFDVKMHDSIIKKSLASFGIELEIGESNSYFSIGKKFSGSAFKNSRKRKLHHGTFLLDGEEKHIQELLTSKLLINKSRSVNSKPSSICFLKELNQEMTKDKLISKLSTVFKSKFEKQSSVIEAEDIPTFKCRPEWLYAQTPLSQFSLEFEKRKIDFEIKRGVITSCTINDLVGHKIYEEGLMNKELHQKIIYLNKSHL